MKKAKAPKTKGERLAIICALADSPFTAQGSVFTHVCSKCGTRLMLAPSGQAVLAQNPTAVLMCAECGPPLPRGLRPTDANLAEIATAIPNPWRTRN